MIVGLQIFVPGLDPEQIFATYLDIVVLWFSLFLIPTGNPSVGLGLYYLFIPWFLDIIFVQCVLWLS